MAGLDTSLLAVLLSQSRRASFRQCTISSQATLKPTEADAMSSSLSDSRGIEDDEELSDGTACPGLLSNRLDGSLPDKLCESDYVSTTGNASKSLHYDNPHLPRSSSDSLLSQPDLRQAVITRDKIDFQQLHMSSYNIDIESDLSGLKQSLDQTISAPDQISNAADEQAQASGTSKQGADGEANGSKTSEEKINCLDVNEASQKLSIEEDPLSCSHRSASFDSPCSISKDDIVKALAMKCGDIRVASRIDKHKRCLNQHVTAWERLSGENNPFVLAGLLFGWLEQLQEPILTCTEMADFRDYTNSAERSFCTSLSKEKRLTIACIMVTIQQLQPMASDMEDRILRRLAISLTADRSFSRRGSQQSANEMNTSPSTWKNFLLPLLRKWISVAAERDGGTRAS